MPTKDSATPAQVDDFDLNEPEVLGVDLLMAQGLYSADLDIDSPELQEVLDADLASDEGEDPSRRLKTTGPRPAAQADEDCSIYQRLVDYGLLRKVTDIVMAKVSIPWHLREDATQEVHMTWHSLKAKKEFQRNQLAHYAHISGQHAALKLRRSIGAVVSIPGAVFRNGRDTTFMNSIGAAVNPHDVEDFKDSIELSVSADEPAIPWVNAKFFHERTKDLDLSQKQQVVAYKTLVERLSVDDIARELGTHVMYVERLLNQVTQKLHALDTAPPGTPTPLELRAQRKARTRNKKQ